jgi:hypothetical protein
VGQREVTEHVRRECDLVALRGHGEPPWPNAGALYETPYLATREQVFQFIAAARDTAAIRQVKRHDLQPA